MADIGGGKGLFSHLLLRNTLENKNSWQSTVIDPRDPGMAPKFREISSGKRVKLTKAEMASIPRIRSPFTQEMAADFDVLVGLHAHGCNILIIQAAKKYRKDLVLLPCCVIGEPINKRPNVDWIESLRKKALELGMKAKTHKLFFKGQNLIIYTDQYWGKSAN